MTKLLVGVGSAIGKRRIDTIEIIDLESVSTNCKNFANFPLKLSGSFGGLGFQDKPVICGGTDVENMISNNCYYLEGNKWTFSPSMNRARAFAAISPSPYPSKSQKNFVTGGIDGDKQLDTAEVLTEQGWETLPQTLPVNISSHCSVLVNSTTVMVIGGSQNSQVSSNTFIFNTENEIWNDGPQLKNERRHHSCGIIRKNNQSEEFSIIVAGGVDQSRLSSIEILDLGSNEWRKGPDFPFEIYASQMVEDQNGGVVLIGGEYRTSGWTLDNLYQLPHGGEDSEWIKMKQTLKIGKRNHVAFFVPDNIVDCS
jgi:hypothetical protein